jgi:DedD protein
MTSAVAPPIEKTPVTAEPPPQPIVDTAVPAAADPVGWSVQLGSFSEPANARQLASRVSEYGYAARVSDFRSDGRNMHRVRVSGFASRDEAEAAASSLSAHGFVPRVFSPAE